MIPYPEEIKEQETERKLGKLRPHPFTIKVPEYSDHLMRAVQAYRQAYKEEMIKRLWSETCINSITGKIRL